jgi:glycosyltransferase 2 family protein
MRKPNPNRRMELHQQLIDERRGFNKRRDLDSDSLSGQAGDGLQREGPESASESNKMKWFKRIFSLILLITIPVLLVNLTRKTDWNEVQQALQNYGAITLLTCFGLVIVSYFLFASYDVISKYYVKHNIPVRQIYPLAMVCYAFNLNLSAWVGGIAMRYRLYSRLGLSIEQTSKVLSLNLITNWLGYILLAGIIFSAGLIEVPQSWKIQEAGLRILGGVLLIIPMLYFYACRFAKKRAYVIKQLKIELPTFSFAMIQAGVSMLNWSTMALLVYWLLPGETPYANVLGILLVSSIAGVVTHIPAGLGVLETIFVTLLSGENLSKAGILAALIMYRALYFIVPLAIATVSYLILEARAKKMRAANMRAVNKSSDDNQEKNPHYQATFN